MSCDDPNFGCTTIVFPTKGELCPLRSLHRLHGQGEKEVETMKQSRRDKLADGLSAKWLKKHEPKSPPRPQPKRPPQERWQKNDRERRRERRLLAKPLLKGV